MSSPEPPVTVEKLSGSYRVEVLADDSWQRTDSPVRVYHTRSIIARVSPGEATLTLILREET